MTVQSVLDALGGASVSGLLAIGGLVALVAGLVRQFAPPDDFSNADFNIRGWTQKQEDSYFREKHRFEHMRARGDRGFGNSVLITIWLLILITVVLSGILSGATRGQPVTIALIMTAAWLTVIFIIARQLAYRFRRAERYLAFIDGNRDWMRSPRLRD